jgi:hypothetical protein
MTIMATARFAHAFALAATVTVAACGGAPGEGGGQADASGPGGGQDGGGGGGGGGGGDLDNAAGCAGVFNPDQMLDLHLTMAAADWDAVRGDLTNSIYYPAELRCGDGEAQTVGVRRKRSGGTFKVGLKVDMNLYVAGQTFHGLKKLSLENGLSEGDSTGSVKAHLEEYLAWRVMVRSGAISSRAAFVRVHVNGALLGVYTNVEQVDKTFLKSRFGDSSGWLVKHSGGSGDGVKTNEGVANPYEAYFCFWERMGCAIPPAAELAETLPDNLDIDQMLRVGAINALIANTDAIIFKTNNYYYYDRDSGPRAYLPWDLDTVMNSGFDVFSGTVPGGTTMYRDVLFSNWRGDYRELLADLLGGPLTVEAIHAEIDRAVAVAGAALDADPHAEGSASAAAGALESWWTAQHAAVLAQIAAN